MLSNITFLIPVKIDSPDRERNLKLVCKFITNNFNSKIIIKEYDDKKRFNEKEISHKNISYIYEKNPNNFFHKTKILNDLIVISETDIVVQYDSDIILPINSYLEASKMIKNGYDAVYPFIHGYFSNKKVRVNNVQIEDFLKTNNFSILDNASDSWQDTNNNGYAHFGFCTFYNKKSYIDSYMENEQFCSWGPEDQEIYHRFIKLDLKVGRVNDVVYHIEHFRGQDSSDNHNYYINNMHLFDQIMSMNKEELKKYYSSLPYYKNRINQIKQKLDKNDF